MLDSSSELLVQQDGKWCPQETGELTPDAPFPSRLSFTVTLPAIQCVAQSHARRSPNKTKGVRRMYRSRILNAILTIGFLYILTVPSAQAERRRLLRRRTTRTQNIDIATAQKKPAKTTQTKPEKTTQKKPVTVSQKKQKKSESSSKKQTAKRVSTSNPVKVALLHGKPGASCGNRRHRAGQYASVLEKSR